jgi:hypothetical protein
MHTHDVTASGWSIGVLAVFLILLACAGPTASADRLNPIVFGTEETVYGLSYKQWTIKWWQWFFSIPPGNHPVDDSTGRNCNIGQSGPVWFLAGTSGGAMQTRFCEIPEGKAILFPILNGECDYISNKDEVHNVEDLTNCARRGNEKALNMEVRVDGTKLNNPSMYRVTTGPFPLTIPKDNVFDFDPGKTTAVSDGYYAFLKPLGSGNHTLFFEGEIVDPVTSISNYNVQVTYNLEVK